MYDCQTCPYRDTCSEKGETVSPTCPFGTDEWA